MKDLIVVAALFEMEAKLRGLAAIADVTKRRVQAMQLYSSAFQYQGEQLERYRIAALERFKQESLEVRGMSDYEISRRCAAALEAINDRSPAEPFGEVVQTFGRVAASVGDVAFEDRVSKALDAVAAARAFYS